MRLIDADALIERWKYHFDHRDSLVNCIRTQPTAYDVEKVVAELEELKQEKVIGTHKVMIKEAIDIVKRGGKDD